MTITPEQSKEYLANFDNFLIKSVAIVNKSEVEIENFFKTRLRDVVYNNIIADYFIDEIISLNGLLVVLILLIILYIILRRRD